MGWNKHVSSATHANLKWTAKDPSSILLEVHDSPWQILAKKSKLNDLESQTTCSNQIASFVAAKGSIYINVGKRKFDDNNMEK